MLDARAHHKHGARYVVAVGKFVLGNHRSGFFMVGVCVRIFLFKLAQRLDAMIGNDYYIGVLIDVLQNRAKHFVEGNVLVRESALPDAVDTGVVSDVERGDCVQPMSGAVRADGMRSQSM